MGGSSSQTIGQRYFAKLTNFIGNPIEKLIGINFDNRGWIFKPDNDETFLRVESPNLYGDKEGGVAGFIDIHTGTADQLPNTTYTADFPKVSGYPFQSYLLFRGLGRGVSAGGVIGEIAGIIAKRHHYNKSFYHGNSGYMKEMLLWPQRVHVRNDGRPQWYDEKAEILPPPEADAPEYDFDQLSWEMTGKDGADGMSAIPVGDFGTTSFVIQSENIPANKIFDITLAITASTESRDVVGGEQVGKYTWIKKGGVYGAASGYNRYMIQISEPPATYYFNHGISQQNYDDAERSAVIKIQVKNGATVTCICDPVDNLMAKGATRGYHQYMRFSASSAVSRDLNPIHKIREILTDDTAMNKPESDVNDANFKKAADVLHQEKLGISWSVTEKSCLEAINELCGHIEAGVRMNRQTGLYEMVLFRDDWFAENEVHTLPVNKIKSMQLDGATSADELINKLNVSYYNQSAIKTSSFSIAENAAIRNLNGHENSDDVKFPYFMHQRNAAIVSQWKLKQVSTPVWQGTFTTGFYQARKWNRYDLLKLEWPRRWSGTILVRIMKINLGTGTDVSIDFVEVVPYSSNLSSSIVIDTPVDTTPKPPLPALFKAFELSYLEAVQLNGQKAVDEALAYNPDAGYAAVIAQRPQSNSLNALMYTDIGNDFERAGAIVYSETAELDQSLSKMDHAFIVKKAGDIDMVSTGTQITVNNEIMVYQSYDEETGLLTVKRGALDTVPQNHLAGSILYFADDFVTVDPTEYVTGEIINVKALTTTPSGILDLDDTEAQQVEIQARAIRPYPPANVKINGEYWPEKVVGDATLVWVDRNRLQQTGGDFLSWFDGGVAVESGVTYHYKTVNDSDVVLSSGDNISSGLVLETADFYPKALLTLWAKRDGFDSQQKVEILLISAIGEVTNFIEPIYAKGEKVSLVALLSNGVAIASLSVTVGALPTGWAIVGNTVDGKATLDGEYHFTIEVVDVNTNLIQKSFTVKVQGQTWAQLRFDAQNMTDEVAGNSWTLGSGNTFTQGFESGYGLKMGGIAAAMLTKSMTQTTSFTMSCRIKLTKLATDYIPILYMGDSNSNSNRDCIYIIPVNGENILRSYRQAGTGTSATFNAPDSLPMNEWVRIAYEINGVSQRLFINDELVASGIYSTTISSFTAAYIGLVRAGGDPLYRDGVDIDDVLITTGANRFS